MSDGDVAAMERRYDEPYPADERLDLPSASGLEGLILCPGKPRQCSGMPSPDSGESTRGTRIHAANAGGDTSQEWADLNREEKDTAERCLFLRDQAIKAWAVPGIPWEVETTPQRLFLRRGIMPIFSGECDVIVRQGARALVLDYKASWGDHTESASNPQLMSYAVLIDAETGEVLDSVTVGIIQPLVGGPVELTQYGRTALGEARAAILIALEASARPDAPRVPGIKQCNFCEGKLNCPEANKALVVMGSTQLVPSDSSTALSFNGQDLVEFIQRCKLASRMSEKGQAWALAIVAANPERYAEHFRMEESKGREAITDLETVHQRMIEAGAKPADVMACMTARKADSKTGPGLGLKDVLGRATEKKGKALSSLLEGVLKGCTTPGAVKRVAVPIGLELDDGEGAE